MLFPKIEAGLGGQEKIDLKGFRHSKEASLLIHVVESMQMEMMDTSMGNPDPNLYAHKAGYAHALSDMKAFLKQQGNS